MPLLKPHQLETLRSIYRRGSVPRDEVDGRVLRPLVTHELVVEGNGVVRATPAGAKLSEARTGEVAPLEPRHAGSRPGGAVSNLSEKQEEVLRYILRQTGPVPEDHVDGRVMRALLSRNLVTSSGGWVRPTDVAATFLHRHAKRERQTSVRRATQSARGARGEAILRAVDLLEEALPRDAELMIGGHPAYGDDIVAGLRRMARAMV